MDVKFGVKLGLNFENAKFDDGAFEQIDFVEYKAPYATLDDLADLKSKHANKEIIPHGVHLSLAHSHISNSIFIRKKYYV